MTPNGLTLHKEKKSSIEKIELQQGVHERVLMEFSTRATLVAYFVHEVLIGVVENNAIDFQPQQEFDETYLTMLRVFDEKKELFLRKTGNTFTGRIRIDDQGEPCEYIEADQILLGTSSEVKDGYTFLKEDNFFRKGLTLPGEFPFSQANTNSPKPIERLAIKTINYIGYNEAFQAEYIDSRFVKFCPAKLRPVVEGGEQ